MMDTLTYSLTSLSSLYSAYMPFVKGGGIFIRTAQSYALGAPVHLSIWIMNEAQSWEMEGKVVWITPKDAQNNKITGVGVQFLGEKRNDLRHRIETYLEDMLKSSQFNDTI